MTDSQSIPDWVRVKLAAVVGVGTPLAASFIDAIGPILDLTIKAGQVGVVAVTILYTFSKWRQLRNRKK